MVHATPPRQQSGHVRLVRRVRRLLFYALVLLIALYLLFPLYWLLRTSLSPEVEVVTTPVEYLPAHPTLQNYVAVVQDPIFVRALLNSVLVGVAVTLLSLLLGTSAAYALSRFRFRGRSFMMYLILSMTVFPQIAVLGALYEMVHALYLYDTLYALIPTYLLLTLPFAVWNLNTFFRSLPRELEDAAYIDGATPIQTFSTIMLPLAVPGLITTALLTFIAAWNEFLFVLSFEFSPQHMTAALYIAESTSSSDISWGPVAASIVVVEIPVVALILLFQRGLSRYWLGLGVEDEGRTVAPARRKVSRPAPTLRARSGGGWPMVLFLGGLLTVSVAAFTWYTIAGRGRSPQRLGIPSDDGASIVAEHRLDHRTLDLTVASPALGGTEKVRLLLPPDWRSHLRQRWPVLYLLHGANDTYVGWTRWTDVEQLTAHTDVLVVMPDAGSFGWYSNYWNDGRDGPPRWETFHLSELRQILERNFRAGSRRAIAGLSMGGYGAMKYAEVSHLFRAAASFSGALDPLGEQSTARWPFPSALWGDPVAQRSVWVANDPTDHVARLRGVALFVASGSGRPGPYDDPTAPGAATVSRIESEVDAESHRFVQALQRAHLPVETDFYGPGYHAWPYWQRELHRAFPLLMRAIGARAVPSQPVSRHAA